MSEYIATVEWQRNEATFTSGRYSRAHRWRFDGGLEVPASSSPHVVKLPYSDPAAVDPEEAFVAAISSCHMLTFLYIAAKRGFIVDRYFDQAVGVMETDKDGKLAITRVTLRPAIDFAGADQPSPADLEAMHHQAHEECFIASSVKTDIHVAIRACSRKS